MTVMVTYPHANTVSHSFMYSLLNMARDPGYDEIVDQIVPTRGYPGVGLILARNAAVDIFLRSSADWLWTLDTDMGFEPDALKHMLRHGDNYGIVSGFYKTVLETGDLHLDGSTSWREFPLALQEDGNGGFHPYDKYEGAMEVDAVGAGCLLVHRDVFQAIGGGWYDTVPHLGEDFSFCLRARQAGYKILCDTDIQLSHHKAVWLRGN